MKKVFSFSVLIGLWLLSSLAFTSHALEMREEKKSEKYLLFEQAMGNHRVCRSQLDLFVKRAFEKLDVNSFNVSSEEENIADVNEKNYLFYIHPRVDEAIAFLCKGNILRIWYEFEI